MRCQYCGIETNSRCCIECANKKLGLNTTSYSTASGEDAGFWLRLVAWLIDSTVIFILVWIFAYLSLYILGSNFLLATNLFIEDILLAIFGKSKSFLFAILISLLAGFIAWFLTVIVSYFVFGYLYAVFFESSKFRATPGKLAVGIEVTDQQENTINFKQATLRHLGKFLFIPTISLSFVMAGFSANKQALHDILSKCYVIKGSKYSPMRAIIVSSIVAVIVALFLILNTTVKVNSSSKKSKSESITYSYDSHSGKWKRKYD